MSGEGGLTPWQVRQFPRVRACHYDRGLKQRVTREHRDDCPHPGNHQGCKPCTAPHCTVCGREHTSNDHPRGRGSRHVIADCPTCGEMCPAPDTSRDAHRMWAQRHADKTGHMVLVETTATRAYYPKGER